MLKNHQTGRRSVGPVGLSLVGLVAATALAALHAGLGTAQEKSESDTSSKVPSRAQLVDKQLDVSLEARDIERVLGKLKRASDLSKQRITDAALKAESVSGALDRGDSPAARTDAEAAIAMFREIAKQLEALLAEETPQRVAAAQNLAQRLSMAERQFAQQFPGVLNPTGSGTEKVDPRSKIRPQNNPNKSQEGNGKKGKQQGNAGGGDRPKTQDDKDKAGDEKNKEGGDSSKKEMPEGGKKGDTQQKEGTGGEKGDMPPDAGKQNQNGKGDAKEETKDGDGAGKKKKKDMTQQGGRGGNEKSEEDPTSPAGNAGMSEEDRREALARRAQELAESGKTLEDILKAITDSAEPEDAEAVRHIQAVLKETNLTQAIASMQQAADSIRAGNLDEVRLGSLDVADRMEIASQRLGSAYRLIVAPQAEELRDAEKILADLRERLEQLETPAQIAAWHREARQFLDKLEKLGISDEIREELSELMKKVGFDNVNSGGPLDWQLVNGRYVAPGDYTKILVRLQEDIQTRLQSILLGDFNSAPDDATPPKYQELVERYYQVLSREGGREKPRMDPAKSDRKSK